ncbi:hypothetical protein H632_c2165p0 [Helicosporidium sp. ATCC 50920]|nr:hypothetical protein H632_c2165p0 [Helicosporidium sp. ATCC 50920]|eukprot:KDD73451.1 hypothetical protein H632_c2165p0 [Helicosporidium sp. ATCC 50920]
MEINESVFREKLKRLDSTAASIESTSAWVCYYRSSAPKVATVWEDVFEASDQEKRLSLIYLANDICQTSRRKGPEFAEQFFRVLPRALTRALAQADELSRQRLTRVVRVWEERGVFGSSGSAALRSLLSKSHAAAAEEDRPRAGADAHKEKTSAVAGSKDASSSKAAGNRPGAGQMASQFAAPSTTATYHAHGSAPAQPAPSAAPTAPAQPPPAWSVSAAHLAAWQAVESLGKAENLTRVVTRAAEAASASGQPSTDHCKRAAAHWAKLAIAREHAARTLVDLAESIGMGVVEAEEQRSQFEQRSQSSGAPQSASEDVAGRRADAAEGGGLKKASAAGDARPEGQPLHGVEGKSTDDRQGFPSPAPRTTRSRAAASSADPTPSGSKRSAEAEPNPPAERAAAKPRVGPEQEAQELANRLAEADTEAASALWAALQSIQAQGGSGAVGDPGS